MVDLRTRRSFVGRAHELDELGASLDEAIEGRGSLLLVTGEPGIGKTRLLSEVAAVASQRGALVTWGRCWEGNTPAYQPWVDALRPCFGELDPDGLRRRLGDGASYLAHVFPELGDEEADARVVESDLVRFRLFDAVWRLLQSTARERPIVLQLDDLHWSDVTSIRLLEFVARNLIDAPVLIVGAYREVDARLRPELGEALAAISRHARSLPLRGLSPIEVERFVKDSLDAEVPVDVTPKLHAVTGGNPFFVDSLVRLLVSESEIDPHGRLPIPDGVRDVIRRRLAALNEHALEVLGLASVVGRTFLADVVAEASGRGRDMVRATLWEACRLDLMDEIEPGVGAYTFVHELVRETLYDDLPPDDRMRAHLVVADALQRLRRAESDPTEVAGHLFKAAEAADRRQTLEHVRLAGEHAMGRLAYDDAVMWFERAIAVDELIDEKDHEARFELLCALGEANRRAARFGASMEAYGSAAALGKEIGSSALAKAAVGFEDVRMAALNFMQLPASMLQLRGALEAIGDDDPVRRAQLCARLAQVLLFIAPEEAVEIAREGMRLADQQEDAWLRAEALEGLRWAIWHPAKLSERLAVSTDLLATAQQAGHEEGTLKARNFLTIDFLEAGELGAVAAQIAAYERGAAGLQQAWFNWWPAAFRVARALMIGALTDAEAHLDELRAAASSFDSLAPIVVTLTEGIIGWERSDAQAVKAAVERFLPLVPLPGMRESASVFARTACGDVDGAREWVQSFIAALPQVPDGFMRPSLAAIVTPGIALVDDRAAAETIYETLAPLAGRPLLMAPLPCFQTTSHWLGVLAATAGRANDAHRHFEEALALAERLKAPAWLARTQLEFGRLLLERDRDRAVSMLREALVGAERMGLVSVAEQARKALGERAVATPGRTVFRCDGNVWTLSFGDATAQLADAKGLRYVRELLARPGEEIHVLDLVSVVEGNVAQTSSKRGAVVEAGLSLSAARGDDVVDAEARAAYRARIEQLGDEIDAARSLGDDARAGTLSAELAALTDELSRSVGLGGRVRQTGAAAERARVNVTRSIARAISQVSAVHPTLGQHLRTSVRTGTFCLYTTDPAQPIRWST